MLRDTLPYRALKRVLPVRFRARSRLFVEDVVARLELGVFFLRRKARKLLGTRQGRAAAGLDFAMLCTKRPTYIRQAIRSINSLHFFNPTHRVILYTDAACHGTLVRKGKWLDYPDRVRIVLRGDFLPTQPFQYHKREVVLEAARQGGVYVDADSRWHADPADHLDLARPTFLYPVNAFSEIPLEADIIRTCVGRPEWMNRIHYNVGLVYIPREKYSERLVSTVNDLVTRIYETRGMEGYSDYEKQVVRRTCEEIGISLAAQHVFPAEEIQVLKKTDGPGDRNILESFFYGCRHSVWE